MALVPRRETPAPPSLVPTKLKQGKAHSLAFRERIAIAVHSAKTSDPKRPLSEVAEMFAVDRKTAYKYYQWWKQDRENGVDYSNPDHLKKSLLHPLTWKTKNADRAWEVRPHDWLETRFRPRIAGREPADPRELWTRLSKHLADLQTNHLPQYTAADLVIAVEKVASKGREVLPRAEPPLRLQSYYDPDTIEPVYPLDYATHEAAATRTRRAAAEAAAAAEAEADNRAIVPVDATSGALVVPPRSSRAIVRRPDRANDRIIVFPFMKDSVRKKLLEVQKFVNENKITLTEADVERARKEHKLSYKTIAYDHQEKDLKSVKEEKKVFREIQATLYAEDCVFIDEFHVVMNLAPTKGWTMPGKHAPLRRIEQRFSKTTVLAAMRWPSEEKPPHLPRVAFFLRILPPLPGRITNQNPCNTAQEREVADVLRGQVWWEGIMMLVGGYIRLFDPVPFHDISLFKVKARLVRRKESKKAQEPPPPPYTPLPLRQDFRQVIVEGRYADVFPTRVNQVAGQVGFLPEVEQLWKKSGQDAVMLPDAVSSGAMRDTFWSFLPGWNARRDEERSTIADFLATVTTLPSPEDKLEFVIRLAAHDFVMMHYIRRHNYPVKQRIYGDEISDPTSLAEFAKDLPPGVMFKNVTPLLRGGNDDIKVNGMLKETEEAARASMLTYPETGNADKSHDDEDEKSGSQLMVEKLMQVFQNASLRDILKAVFYDENDRKHKELDDFFSSDADNSAMFDRDYVNRKLRIADGAQKTARLTNLARAIYRALSVHWTIQGMSSSMTPLDVATHIWFIVHHCKGQEHWMDGKLRDMKEPYVYGYPPKIDPDFRGHVLAKDVLTHFRTKSGVSRTEVLPIHIARRHFSDKYAGAPPLPVTKTVFKWFLESLPDGFVQGKTIIMDGASVHAKPANEQRQKNKDLEENRVYPDGEMSEFALLLRKRGAGDALLHPPTFKRFKERKPALVFLPPFSPEFNPIELAFNTAKHFIRRESARVGRTRLNLSYVIINAFHALIRPHAIKNYMLCSGYRSVEKNVVPVVLDKAKEDAETIQEVSAWSAADVLLPVRRGCMAQFVDGKYEDPSKERRKESRVGREYEDPSEEPRTESSVGRSLTYRDYTNAAPITDAYPGKAGRQGMDFRVPVRRTCETEKNAESGHVREVWTQDADIRVGAKIVKCKRKQASDYRDRDEVEVRLMGRGDWVDAVVVSAPAPGAVHNPWIGVTVPGDPNVKYVTVNRVRDRTEKRVLAAERARRAMDENENARKALVAKRADDRKSKGAQADEERRRLWNAGDARRDKFLLQFVRGGADPLAMLRASERELKGVKPLTDEEADRLPEAYTRLLVS